MSGCSPQLQSIIRKKNIDPHPKGAASLAGSGFLIMKKGMIFFEEYFDYMDDMTPEQYYQFMGLIRDLRYNGVDTNVNDVEDRIVRLAWRAVRPSIMKSLENAKGYEKRKEKVEEAEPVVSTYTESAKEDSTCFEAPFQQEEEDLIGKIADSEPSQSEEEFGRSMIELWKTDKNKATRMMNDECGKRGYNFFNVLEVVRNG